MLGNFEEARQTADKKRATAEKILSKIKQNLPLMSSAQTKGQLQAIVQRKIMKENTQHLENSQA